jgi:hypothetical protein
VLDNSWQALYEAAVLEVDRNKLVACLKTAEHAISARLVSLGGQISRDEMLAMRDALASLRALQRDGEQNAVRELKHHKIG